MQKLIDLLDFLKSHADTLGVLFTLIGILITLICLLWTARSYISVKRDEKAKERYTRYHDLIRDLVQPPPGQTMALDRQIAVVFELRLFPEYFHVSRRILRGLRATWTTAKADQRLITEIDYTLSLINKRVKPEGYGDV